MATARWRKLAIAGLAGFGCGRLVKLAREHPDAAAPIIRSTAVAGGVGVVCGFVVAKRRKVPLYIHSLSLGANFAVVTALFLGLRQAAQNVAEQFGYKVDGGRLEYQTSSISGGITGATSAIVSRLGLLSATYYLAGGAALGATGQYAYNRFERWRLAKALELHYPELVPAGDKQTKKTFRSSFTAWEQRVLAFAHREGTYSSVEREVDSLAQAIKEEKAAIELLDEQLALHTRDHPTETTHQTPEHEQGYSSH